jgi:hypothetical protein
VPWLNGQQSVETGQTQTQSPEQRSIKDDALEAILKGATTVTPTILASILVRRLFKS